MADYGRDLSCTDSLTTGRYVTGVRLIAQALYRRLTTPRGMLRGGEEEAIYGLDLTELLGASLNDSATEVATLAGRIEAECLKDDRVEDVSVTVSATRIGPAFSYVVILSVVSSAGPFDLTLGVKDVTVSLLGLNEGAS
jgi:hypothetical protein